MISSLLCLDWHSKSDLLNNPVFIAKHHDPSIEHRVNHVIAGCKLFISDNKVEGNVYFDSGRLLRVAR